MEEKILKIAETYLDKNVENNGTCISITIERLNSCENLEKEIKTFATSICYRYNSAEISSDIYGIKRLVLFSV